MDSSAIAQRQVAPTRGASGGCPPDHECTRCRNRREIVSPRSGPPGTQMTGKGESEQRTTARSAALGLPPSSTNHLTDTLLLIQQPVNGAQAHGLTCRARPLLTSSPLCSRRRRESAFIGGWPCCCRSPFPEFTLSAANGTPRLFASSPREKTTRGPERSGPRVICS